MQDLEWTTLNGSLLVNSSSPFGFFLFFYPFGAIRIFVTLWNGPISEINLLI